MIIYSLLNGNVDFSLLQGPLISDNSSLKDNGNNFFIPDTSTTEPPPPGYEYAISFHPNCFILELFHRKYSVCPPSCIDFQRLSFGSHDLCGVKSRVEYSKQQIYFIRRILRLHNSSTEFGTF